MFYINSNIFALENREYLEIAYEHPLDLYWHPVSVLPGNQLSSLHRMNEQLETKLVAKLFQP